MSEEQLKAFLAKVKGDSNLQAKLKAAKSTVDLVGIPQEHDHEFAIDCRSMCDVKSITTADALKRPQISLR